MNNQILINKNMDIKNENENSLIETFGKEKRWVNWKLLEVSGRQTKVPYSITGHKASTINESTWSTYEEVKTLDNIGLVLTPDRLLLGIDIDHCIEEGTLPESVRLFVELVNTYTEISPSGKGLHLFVKLTAPLKLLANRHAPYELYTDGRYLTVTKNIWGDNKKVRMMTPEEVINVLGTIGYPWKETVLTSSTDTVESMVLDDASVLDKMFASKGGDEIYKLYNGDISVYENDDSRADMAMCSFLAFWAGRDATQIERIWFNSPLGQRAKVQGRRDYRERTVRKAIQGCKEVYQQGGPRKVVRDLSYYPPSMSHTELISKEFPPVRYILEPFYEKAATNMVSAPPNGWKSWFIFLSAGNIVSGTPVLDKFPTEKANVMIVNEEDIPFLIQDRLKRLNFVSTNLPIYYRIAQGSKLTEDFVENLITEAKEKNIGVIMFDSLRAIHDADENSSKEMQVVMDLFKKINREGITVVFTHHHKKKNSFGKGDDAEMSRGSSAINAAISGHISLEEVDKEGEKYIIVKHLKSKAGKKVDPFDVGISIGEGSVNFKYLGEHKPKERALDEAINGIRYHLQSKKMLMSRKDFVYLKVGGTTTVREATKIIEKDTDGDIKFVLRGSVGKCRLKPFNSEGKPNEKLYFIEEDSDFTVFDNISPESNM